MWLNKKLVVSQALSALCVVSGIGIAYENAYLISINTFLIVFRTVQNVELNMYGLIVLMVASMASSMQQIMCNHLQKKYNIPAPTLLLKIIPFQVFSNF